MRKEMYRMLTAIIISASLVACSATRYAGETGGAESEKTIADTEDAIADTEGAGDTEEAYSEQENISTETETEQDISSVLKDVSYDRLYMESLKIANEEQKEKLLALGSLRNDWVETRVRDTKVIMGLMPEDAPRLTLDDAWRICEEYYSQVGGELKFTMLEDLIDLFNSIAVSPDIYGGSGLTHVFYYLDDHTELISIQYGRVCYHSFKDNTTVILLDWYQNLPAGTVLKDGEET